MDRLLVLVTTFELHNVGLPAQMLHNLNLPLDVLLVVLGDKLPLRNRLAGVFLAGRNLGAEIRHAELASAQFFSNGVPQPDILKRFSENCVV
ncbi:hypothetical protein ACFX11_007403 [Malus domestica]